MQREQSVKELELIIGKETREYVDSWRDENHGNDERL
jgi:hypothetical protein